MPIYDYQCTECRAVYEVVDSWSAKKKWVVDFVAEGDDESELGLICPSCGDSHEHPDDSGKSHQRVVGKQRWRDTGFDPREDRTFPRERDMGLGTKVWDKAHQNWLMSHYPNGRKRPYKLHKLDGATLDLEEMHDEQARLDTGADKELAEYHEEMRNSREYQQAMEYARREQSRLTEEATRNQREMMLEARERMGATRR